MYDFNFHADPVSTWYAVLFSILIILGAFSCPSGVHNPWGIPKAARVLLAILAYIVVWLCWLIYQAAE